MKKEKMNNTPRNNRPPFVSGAGTYKRQRRRDFVDADRHREAHSRLCQ